LPGAGSSPFERADLAQQLVVHALRGAAASCANTILEQDHLGLLEEPRPQPAS
jgi:hypothetical protein